MARPRWLGVRDAGIGECAILTQPSHGRVIEVSLLAARNLTMVVAIEGCDEKTLDATSGAIML
jgi:hypothetical protein